MKIGAIVQARSSSSRFPKKIFKELPINSGISILEHVINRLKKSRKIDDIIIATSTEEEDLEIVKIAKMKNINYFTGDLHDLLSRFYNAAKKFNLDHIVRITSDCPCIDPILIDHLIGLHLKNEADYSSNVKNRTFPRGYDTQIFTFPALEKAYYEATTQFDREHVCPYFYQTNPNSFKEYSLEVSKEDQRYGPKIRMTVDTPDDYILLCAIFDYLYSEDSIFGVVDVIKCFYDHSWLSLLNNKILQKREYTSLEDEISEAIRLLNLQGLNSAAKILERSTTSK